MMRPSQRCRTVTMSRVQAATPKIVERHARLIAELHRVGVRHIAPVAGIEPLHLSPKDLLVELALCVEPHIQPALVLVFLHHPRYGLFVNDALRSPRLRLRREAAQELKLYYQAACYLQRQFEAEVKATLEIPNDWLALPDLFLSDLGVPSASVITPDAASVTSALRLLQALHRRTTGKPLNYVATYTDHVPLLFRYLRRVPNVP